MKLHQREPSFATLMSALLAASSLAAISFGALAQNDSSSISELTVVDLEQIGKPPTGPHAVVVEHDPGLDTHTIYRPRELGSSKHGVLVWGEGGCANNGLMFPEFLSEIASHGFVVIADGPPGARGAGEGGPNGAAARAEPQAPAGGPPRPAGPPGGIRIKPDGTDLVAGMDWIERQSADPESRFFGTVDVSRIAAMGMSCGGLMSYGAANDPRVATVGIWNSGLLEPDQQIFDALHSSVIIVTGGESDIAYANGQRDFETLPERVPVFYGVYPSVGHGGTYNRDNGGAFGVAAVAWLKWQLQRDTSAAGRGFFIGADCTICTDSDWLIDSRSLR